MLYAWASVTSGVPFAERRAEPYLDIPAIQQLALGTMSPSRHDFKNRSRPG